MKSANQLLVDVAYQHLTSSRRQLELEQRPVYARQPVSTWTARRTDSKEGRTLWTNGDIGGRGRDDSLELRLPGVGGGVGVL
jgi:hypothetical protein